MLIACLLLHLPVVQSDDSYYDDERPASSDQARRSGLRAGGYISLGIGSAALTLGAVLFGYSEVVGANNKVEIDVYNASTLRTQEALDVIRLHTSQQDTFRLVGVVLSVVGLSGIITAIVLLVVGREPPVEVAFGPGQLFIGGRF